MNIVEHAQAQVEAQDEQQPRVEYPAIVYTIRDAEIQELRQQFGGLKIEDGNKEQYAAVRAARITVKKYRTAIEATRKNLKEDALEYGRKVDGEAKRLTEMLLEIERPLQAEEDAYDAAEAKRKEEAARAKAARLDEMARQLAAFEYQCPPSILAATSDEGFAVMLEDAKTRHAKLVAERAADEERKAREVAEANERTRLAVEAANAEMERQARLAEEDRQRREEEARNAREEADRVRREADARLLAERQAREEADRVAQEEQRKLRQELARLKKEEDDRKAKAEAEAEAQRQAQLAEAERQRREEAERQTKAWLEQTYNERVYVTEKFSSILTILQDIHESGVITDGIVAGIVSDAAWSIREAVLKAKSAL